METLRRYGWFFPPTDYPSLVREYQVKQYTFHEVIDATVLGIDKVHEVRGFQEKAFAECLKGQRFRLDERSGRVDVIADYQDRRVFTLTFVGGVPFKSSSEVLQLLLQDRLAKTVDWRSDCRLAKFFAL